ncbi:MAG TPA: hypothetical protein VNN10_01360 [Dehalococcoidia bacterium]|nr:hypothetical protein [Dehalococcoidia bacterium]
MDFEASPAMEPREGLARLLDRRYMVLPAAAAAALGLSAYGAALILGAAAAPLAAVAGIAAGAGWSWTRAHQHRHDGSRASLARALERQVDNGRKISIQDRATGLLQKWYFDLRVAEEVSRCKRYGTPMALLRLSAGSGAEEDTWGTETEWRLAQELAHHLRAVDIATRAGPLEFLVCLPHTDLRGVQAAARRLLASLESWSPGVSYATYPEDGDESEALMQAALGRQSPPEGGPPPHEDDAAPASYDEVLAALAEGETAAVAVEAPDTARLVKQRLRHAGRRLGLRVRVWEEDGRVLVRRETAADSGRSTNAA